VKLQPARFIFVFGAVCCIGCPLITLTMEAVSTFETSSNSYQSTRCNIPEDSHLHNFGDDLRSPCTCNINCTILGLHGSNWWCRGSAEGLHSGWRNIEWVWKILCKQIAYIFIALSSVNIVQYLFSRGSVVMAGSPRTREVMSEFIEVHSSLPALWQVCLCLYVFLQRPYNGLACLKPCSAQCLRCYCSCTFQIFKCLSSSQKG
jgi:hypothetical protein